ncbi:MAG: NlpC/P60 family protein [Anaerovoracaceae bacterium]
MIEKTLTSVKQNVLKVGIVFVTLLVIAVAVMVFLHVTKPYAVYGDGQKVEEPWAVVAGDDELFLVASQADGKAVVEGLKSYYTKEIKAPKGVTVTPEVTFVEKDLKRGEEPLTALKTKEAIDFVVTENAKKEPLLAVTTKETVKDMKKIAHKTKVKKSKELYTGDKEVKVEGKTGKKLVVSEITRINGKIVDTDVVKTAIKKKAVTEVVAKGTKEKMTASVATASVSRGGAAIGRGSTNEVVNYALQFVGNPYVYGGNSLTNGTDCSGFTKGVYAKFGISLPRTSGAQASVGKSVSYSEAKPGDLLCYPGHVGIYIGNGQIVHASTPATGIKIGSATYRSISSVRRIME